MKAILFTVLVLATLVAGAIFGRQFSLTLAAQSAVGEAQEVFRRGITRTGEGTAGERLGWSRAFELPAGFTYWPELPDEVEASVDEAGDELLFYVQPVRGVVSYVVVYLNGTIELHEDPLSELGGE